MKLNYTKLNSIYLESILQNDKRDSEAMDQMALTRIFFHAQRTEKYLL